MKDEKKQKPKGNYRQLLTVPVLVLALFALSFGSVLAIQLYSEVSNMSGLHLQGTFTTATPILMADQQGTGRLLELRDNATPVVFVDDGGNGTFDANLKVDDVFNIDDNVQVVSGATTITPTMSFLYVAPTVASTVTLATASAEAGDLLIVVNTVSTNTNIVDTGATAGGASIDLGLNDLAFFIYINSKWVEVASPDNS